MKCKFFYKYNKNVSNIYNGASLNPLAPDYDTAYTYSTNKFIMPLIVIVKLMINKLIY